jgi:uncharacterized protein YdaT
MPQDKKPLGLSKPKKISVKRALQISDSLISAPTKSMTESDSNYAKSERLRKLVYSKMTPSQIKALESRKDSLITKSLKSEVKSLREVMNKKYPKIVPKN